MVFSTAYVIKTIRIRIRNSGCFSYVCQRIRCNCVDFIHVMSILRQSTRWNLKNGKLLEIKWTVTSCIYCFSIFSISLSFLRRVKLFGFNLSIGRSVQLINCSILSQRKDKFSLDEISNDKEINLDFVVPLI